MGGKEDTLVLGLRLKAFSFVGRTLSSTSTPRGYEDTEKLFLLPNHVYEFLFFLKKLKITLLRTIILHSS